MQNLNIIKDLKDAIDNNQLASGSHKFYTEVSKLPVIEQYYWVKSLKTINENLFYDTCDAVRKDNYVSYIVLSNILRNIYNIDASNSAIISSDIYEHHDDYKAAFNGMGNIKSYIDVVTPIIGVTNA